MCEVILKKRVYNEDKKEDNFLFLYPHRRVPIFPNDLNEKEYTLWQRQNTILIIRYDESNQAKYVLRAISSANVDTTNLFQNLSKLTWGGNSKEEINDIKEVIGQSPFMNFIYRENEWSPPMME